MSEDIRPGVRRLPSLDLHRPEDARADADAELDSYLEAEAAHLESRGLPPDRAGAAVRATLHHSAETRERRMRFQDWLTDAATDFRHALRTFGKSPGLAAAAILTLALALGANTAIFSAVNAVLLKTLPFADPGRLVMVWEENPDFGWVREDAAPANMLDWREQVPAFADVAAYPSFPGSTTLTGQGEPRILVSQLTTGNLFQVLGVPAALGRTFRDEETWDTGGPPVALLSHRTWETVFGADSALVGKSIQLGGRAVQVIGVLPASFAIPGLEAEVWRPIAWDRSDRAAISFRRAHWLKVVARLKPGASLGSANAELQTVVRRLQRDYPGTNTHMGAGITPLHEFLVGSTRRPLLVMLGAVALLLVIACANVANLLLVRAAARARESALRLALGAGRGRLLRQALAESAVLALLGGGVGLLFGWWGTGALARLQPEGMLPITRFPLSWAVLGYVFFATSLAAAVFAMAPVVWSGRQSPADVLRDEGRGSSVGAGARRWGDLLLAGQVGLALALTLGAGLLVRSYLRLQQVEPGFDPVNVLTVRLSLPGFRYDTLPKVLGFYARLEEEVRGLPGVEAVAAASKVPLGPPSWTSQFAVEGRPPLEAGFEVLHREITPDYFQVLRVPLVRGRMITAADRADAPAVVLVNQEFVRRHFPGGEDPVGRRIAFDRVPDSTSAWRTIVGVVGNERQNALSAEPRPEIYAPYPQEPRNAMYLVARTRGEPELLAPAVRAIVKQMDPALAISEVTTMEQVHARAMGRDRFLAVLMLSFAGVGLVLGLVGVYGVVAQLARRRMRELGIRVALGARSGAVQWLVVRHGLVVTGIGVAAGIGVALAASGVLRSLLYQVAPADPVVFIGVPLLVLATATLASWLPARRASRVDPCEVLRGE